MFGNNTQKQETFVSYTKYLKDKKQKQIKQIEKIKSKNQRKQKNCNGDAQTMEKNNLEWHPKNKNKVIVKQRVSLEKQNWVKIDQKASIVKGKLVYMEDERPSVSDSNQLINMLKENQIRIKQYIYGDKKKIREQMETNYKDSKNQQVQRYINKNMKQENAVRANHSSWYDQAKEFLFSDK